MIRWCVTQMVPDDESTFLCPAELTQADSMTIAKRRDDWVRGRYAVKSLAAAVLHQDLRALSIVNDAGGVPRLIEFPQFAISISHSQGQAAAALCLKAHARVGIDLELVESRAPVFVRDWFTGPEQRAAADDATVVTTIWSAKEAVLKALGHGLRVDTRRVTCLPAPPCEGWADVRIACGGLHHAPVHAWWRRAGGHVVTLATTAA